MVSRAQVLDSDRLRVTDVFDFVGKFRSIVGTLSTVVVHRDIVTNKGAHRHASG